MTKVALVDPRGWQGAAAGYRPSPNVGIAYLISALRRSGHEVLVIDLNNESLKNEEVLTRIREYDPGALGFSAKTATIGDARILARSRSRGCYRPWDGSFRLVPPPHRRTNLAFWKEAPGSALTCRRV